MQTNQATWGRILGAIGALLLLSSPMTFFFSGTPLQAAIKATCGALLIALFLFAIRPSLRALVSRRSHFLLGGSLIFAVLWAALLVGVNYIAAKKNKTWDLTSKKIYTLAPQTVSTLRGLTDKIHAIAFLDGDHPHYEAVQQLLARYHREAPETFDYTFKDPRKNPDLAAKYELKEGQTTIVLTRGIANEQTHTALNVLSEQELTNALIKLNSTGEQKVYFVTGHGEWPLRPPNAPDAEDDGASLSELRASLAQEGYRTESIHLAIQRPVPVDAAVLVIAGSRSPFAGPEIASLRAYLEQGGRLLVFAEALREPGLDKLLEEHGVQIDAGILADEQLNPLNPYVILSAFYADHEITALLKQMQMTVELPTVRALTILREGVLPGIKAEPVLLTSGSAWVELKPQEHARPDQGEKSGQMPMVVAVTRPAQTRENRRFDEMRMVVMGDSELLVDANWGHAANRNLVLNIVAWASSQTKKITIRPPDRDVSTLDLDPKTLSRLKFVSTDLLPLTFLALGWAIWIARRNR